MVREGYVVSEDGSLRTAMPVYSQEQYYELMKETEQFICSKIGQIIDRIDAVSEKVIIGHTPNHLKESALRIAAQNRFYHTVCAPAKKMVQRKYLNTSFEPLEMPTAYIVI